ncbi:S8 family serine peptidase [bacterium]|nr:S8 family serine peptidase [bacterium]
MHRMLTIAAVGLLAAGTSTVLADSMTPYGESHVNCEALARMSQMPAHPVITDDLYYLVNQLNAKGSRAARQDFARRVQQGVPRDVIRLKGPEQSEIQIYVHLRTKAEPIIKELESMGLEVEAVSPGRPIVQGYADLSVLELLAAHPEVRQISLPNYGTATSGPIESEGDSQQGTVWIRNQENVNGDGVIVGVVSNGLYWDGEGAACDSLFHYDDELPLSPWDNCGQIPTNGWYGGIRIFPNSWISHEVDPDFKDMSMNPFPEGSAIMEVIHDVAPGATMIYADGRTDVYLELARLFMQYNDADIVVENMVYAGAGRYDGSSWISRSATDIARNTNTPFIISAGGSMLPTEDTPTVQADRLPMVVTGLFNPDPRDNRQKVHSWNLEIAEDRDEGLSIRSSCLNEEYGECGRFGPIIATLVWDDFWSDTAPRADDDLDLYLVPRDSLNIGEAVASSRRLQNGDGANPVERLVFEAVDDTPYALVILRKNSHSNARTFFTLVIESGMVEEPAYLTHGVALNNADALPPVITVGHINQDEKLGLGIMPSPDGPGPLLESTGRFLTWFSGQRFLDIVGYSSVSTASSDYYTPNYRAFVGPSAAVSHIAGFAALLRQRYPEMPPQQMRHIFMDTSGVGIGGVTVFPMSVDITPDAYFNQDGSEKFENAPTFLKPEPINIYANLSDELISAYSSVPSERNVPLAEQSESGLLTTAWTSGPGEPLLDLQVPEFRVSEMGLELKPSAGKSWGYWYSPLLEVQTEFEDQPRTTLRTDRLYVAEVRVGTDETDPTAVPDFRLRLTTDTGEESASLVVAGLSPDSEQAPTTIGGKTYRLYYRPSNDAVAQQGVHLAFEVLNIDPSDNQDATIVLRDVKFSELYTDGIGVE